LIDFLRFDKGTSPNYCPNIRRRTGRIPIGMILDIFFIVVVV
jgi:hypothetical protein